jgi:ABC-type arginine/histidine transport system permease subunit
MTGEWLAHCGACPVPEIANAFNRARIGFHQVTGTLQPGDPAWQEIDDWIEAARVANTMAHNRLGLMGHYYNGMLDIHTDTTRQIAYFGGHLEIVEVEELAAMRRGVTAAETHAKLAEFRQTFDIQPDCAPIELERAARTSVALDKLVAAKNLGSLAYYHMGTGNEEHEDVMSSVILGNSLLTASVVLALMILPTITAISRSSLVAVPRTLREGAYALGSTRWEAIFRVILPTAAPGVVAATILALGRAMGETMAVAMLIGNSPRLSFSLFAPSGTLASLLANQFGEAEGMQVSALMYAALVLVALTLVVNIAGEAVLRLTERRTAGIR